MSNEAAIALTIALPVFFVVFALLPPNDLSSAIVDPCRAAGSGPGSHPCALIQ